MEIGVGVEFVLLVGWPQGNRTPYLNRIRSIWRWACRRPTSGIPGTQYEPPINPPCRS